MPTCECGLTVAEVAMMTKAEHVAAHQGEPVEHWVTFSSCRLPTGQRLLTQKWNGSTRTVVVAR